MAYKLRACPFCGGEANTALAAYASGATAHVVCDACGAKVYGYGRGERGLRDAVESWNRRAERTWHDFSDELPPVGASVLCRGKNGALYVGKLVTFNGNGTRKVWVPRGDQYRTPEKWKAVDES